MTKGARTPFSNRIKFQNGWYLNLSAPKINNNNKNSYNLLFFALSLFEWHYISGKTAVFNRTKTSLHLPYKDCRFQQCHYSIDSVRFAWHCHFCLPLILNHSRSLFRACTHTHLHLRISQWYCTLMVCIPAERNFFPLLFKFFFSSHFYLPICATQSNGYGT